MVCRARGSGRRPILGTFLGIAERLGKDALAGLLDDLVDRLACLLAVLLRKGLQYPLMGAKRPLDPARQLEADMPVTNGLLAEKADHQLKPGYARNVEDDSIEGLRKLAELGGIVSFDCPLHLGVDRPECFHGFARHIGRGVTVAELEQVLPEQVDFFDVATIQARHLRTSARQYLDELGRLQYPKDFPKRTAADAELFGPRLLDEALTRRQPALNAFPFQMLRRDGGNRPREFGGGR